MEGLQTISQGVTTPATENKKNLPLQNPSSDDVKEFERTMRGEEDKDKNTKNTESKQSDVASLFEKMGPLTTLQQGAGKVEGTGEVASMSLTEIEGIVDQILVNSPEDGAPEVKLLIDNPSLKNTEISLTRGADGMLSVVVETTDPSSFQTLVSARGTLMDSLQAKEAKAVQIEIRDAQKDQSADGGQNDHNRAKEQWEAYGYGETERL